VAKGVPPITVTIPEFTSGNFNDNLQQLELDSIRGYNGFAGTDKFGLNLHEFRVALDASDQLIVTIDPVTNVGTTSWERVPVADRPRSGDPDYVNHVLAKSP
jgi:hypothetical protein